jgi:nitrogenase subunit NifH
MPSVIENVRAFIPQERIVVGYIAQRRLINSVPAANQYQIWGRWCMGKKIKQIAIYGKGGIGKPTAKLPYRDS